jgi:predicted ATPase/DNA-binding SARP family transcriptional activator
MPGIHGMRLNGSMAWNMAQLSITLFGSFQVTLDNRPVTNFGTDKTRALLAYLAVEAQRPHRRDALAGLLWPDSPHTKARQSLRQALSQLRQTLNDQTCAVPFLLIDRETAQFNPDSDYWLDVAAFTALAEKSRAHRHQHLESCLPCMRRMDEMVNLYGGSFLGGFFLADSNAFEEWATLQREYLQRQMMDALDRLLDYHQRRGDIGQAIQMARRQVQIEPWREETHRQLMHLLALDGQRSAALAQYRTCQRALAEELGVEPTTETTAFYARIRDSDQGPPEARPHASPARRHNLPPTPTPFIGREEELADLANHLADPDCRLLTLLGPGGIGKTRLALQTAADQVGLYEHGITFVPLDTLNSADLLVPTIADNLGFRFHNQGDPEQQLLDYLREKQLLLVLDNMEHLLDGADFVAKLFSRAPGVTILVTSRERLNLREECVYEIEGLAHPIDPETDALEAFSAVALFVQIASRVQRKFVLTRQNSPAVARICHLVDGMPLAVELAAAWVPARSCQEIAKEIERNLDSLATSLHNVPARHRSLRATFEHSWRLLSEQEQTALRKSSLFRGGFDALAAEQVIGAPTETLVALVDKSLLRRNASGRYEMHRIVRQYAEEKLQAVPSERKMAEHLHSDYYAGFLQDRETWFQGPKQADALEAVSTEVENVRLAWRLASAAKRIETLGRSLTSLGTFYAIRSWHQEGAHAFGQAIEGLTNPQPSETDPSAERQAVVFAACLAWLGHFSCELGRYDEAQGLLEQSLRLLRPSGTTPELAFSLYTLAQILCFGKNDYAEAKQIFEESLAFYQSLGDRYGTAQVLDGLGDVAVRQGSHDEAQRHYEEGLALRRQIGDVWGISTSLGSLGGLAGRLGRYDKARRWFEESLSIGRELGNPRGIAASLHNLSTLAYLQEDYAEAKRLRLETLAICREIGYRWGIASALKSLGDVAGRMGEYGKARQYLLQSLTILEETGDRRSLAYALNSLGTIERMMGRHQEARSYFRHALQAAIEIQEPALALDVLKGIAQLSSEAGKIERALELVAFILHHPASEQQTRAQVGPWRVELAAQLSAKAAATAEARGRAMDLDTIAASILQG